MANKKQTIYTVVSLGVGDGWKLDVVNALKDALVTTCTNKVVLSEMTGISRDRLAYMFIRKGKTILIEGDFMIFKTDVLYKGRQPGGVRNKGMRKPRYNMD